MFDLQHFSERPQSARTCQRHQRVERVLPLLKAVMADNAVYVDTRQGPARIWPPPGAEYVSPAARKQAQDGFKLLASAARTAREDAAWAHAERDAMYDQLMERRSRYQYSRKVEQRPQDDDVVWGHSRVRRRRGFEPPPLERGAWREWSERRRCVTVSRSWSNWDSAPHKRVTDLGTPHDHAHLHLVPVCSLPDEDDDPSFGLRLAVPSGLDGLRAAADAATTAAWENSARLAHDGQRAGAVLSGLLSSLTRVQPGGAPGVQARPWRHSGPGGEDNAADNSRAPHRRSLARRGPQREQRRNESSGPGVVPGLFMGAALGAVAVAIFTVLFNRRCVAAPTAPVIEPVVEAEAVASAATASAPAPAPVTNTPRLGGPGSRGPSPARERLAATASRTRTLASSASPMRERPTAVTPEPVLVAPRVEDILPPVVVAPPPPQQPAPVAPRSTGRDALSALRIRAAAEATKARQGSYVRQRTPRVSSNSTDGGQADRTPRASSENDFMLQARLAEAELKRQADTAAAATAARKLAEDQARARLGSIMNGSGQSSSGRFSAMSSHHAGEILLRVFHAMAPGQRWAALEMMTPAQGAAVVERMSVDECVDTLVHLAPPAAEAVLAAMASTTKASQVSDLLVQRLADAAKTTVAPPAEEARLTHMPVLPTRHAGGYTVPEPLPLTPLRAAALVVEDPEDAVPVPSSAASSRAPSPTPVPVPVPVNTAAKAEAQKVEQSMPVGKPISLAAVTRAAEESRARAKALAAVKATKVASAGVSVARAKVTAAPVAAATVSRPIPSTPVMASASPRASGHDAQDAAPATLETRGSGSGGGPPPTVGSPTRTSPFSASGSIRRRSSGPSAPPALPAILPPFSAELASSNPRVAAAVLSAMRPSAAAQSLAMIAQDSAGTVLSYMALENAAPVLRALQPQLAADVLSGRTARAQAVALEAMGAPDAARVLAVLAAQESQRASALLAEVSEGACRSMLEALPASALTDVVAHLFVSDEMPAPAAAGSSRAPSRADSGSYDLETATAAAAAEHADIAAVLAKTRADADHAASLAADAARLATQQRDASLLAAARVRAAKTAAEDEEARLAAEQEIINARKQALMPFKKAEDANANADSSAENGSGASSDAATGSGRSWLRERMRRQFSSTAQSE